MQKVCPRQTFFLPAGANLGWQKKRSYSEQRQVPMGSRSAGGLY